MADTLQDFILAYCEEVGALVERPAYNLVDILLPDETAHRLQTDPYLRLAFSEEAAAAHPDALHLTYGHPLLERIEEDLHDRGQATHWFINDVRLDKPGLFEVIQKEIGLPNARLQPQKNAALHPQLHHYVRFNFRIALITDEKQEELTSVIMDLHSGQPAWELEEIRSPLPLEQEYRLRPLPDAPPLWKPDLPLFSFERLKWLQELAGQAVVQKLEPQIGALQQRTTRRLELDRARLEAYYDDTAAELEQRIARTVDEDRRRSLEEKLAFTHTERERKLADIEAKYHLRVVIDLINVALITRPKLALEATISNRYISIVHTFFWDPLLHRVDPPLCQVCGQPSYRLHLCTNGHLADDKCILHCSVCKREFCLLCQADIGECSVCGKPVCIHSQVRCKICGRITCPEHVGQCHKETSPLRKNHEGLEGAQGILS